MPEAGGVQGRMETPRRGLADRLSHRRWGSGGAGRDGYAEEWGVSVRGRVDDSGDGGLDIHTKLSKDIRSSTDHQAI